jgi:hypothetical protein
MDGGLARRVHLGAGLNDIAHDDGLDLLGIEPGAGDGGFDNDRAKIGRRNFFKATTKGTDRGAHWRDNNDRMLRHDQTLLVRRMAGPAARRLSISSDAYDEFAEIAPVQHSNEGFRGLVQTVHDVLTITNAAVGNAGSDLVREFVVVLLPSKFGVDEPAQRQALRQDPAHGRQPIGAVTGPRTVVLGDETADRNACVGIERWQHRLPNGVADILEINVDAVWTGRRQLGWKIGRAVIDGGIEAQFVFHKGMVRGQYPRNRFTGHDIPELDRRGV